ncbi:MAG TPA: hypothetical protein VE994_19775 [Terriglobales bacterium]|nr:hypothetical protein [Terriglobales bacterium]
MKLTSSAETLVLLRQLMESHTQIEISIDTSTVRLHTPAEISFVSENWIAFALPRTGGEVLVPWADDAECEWMDMSQVDRNISSLLEAKVPPDIRMLVTRRKFAGKDN